MLETNVRRLKMMYYESHRTNRKRLSQYRFLLIFMIKIYEYAKRILFLTHSTQIQTKKSTVHRQFE